MNQVAVKRQIDGILLLDKPSGCSSNKALQRVKRIFGAAKAGHTGSLDPLATGMLPICFGQATKFSSFLLQSDKTYRVSMLLGIRTATGDREGEIISRQPVPALSRMAIDRTFDSFRGAITQLPPMYSALKHQGQPLYKLARLGITVERERRVVTIHELTVSRFDGSQVEFDVICSKGTYVRTLVEDIGEVLGCGAHVIALRRLAVTPYVDHEPITIEQLECHRNNKSQLDQYLLPLSTSVAMLPEVQLNSDMAFYVKQGQSIILPTVTNFGLVRIMTKDNCFLGVGEVIAGSCLRPRRLMSVNK